MAIRSITLAAALLVGAAVYAQAPAPSRTVWDGVFTAAQAERGNTLYQARCAGCHGGEMTGGGGVPGLIGPELLSFWDKKTAGALFEVIQTTMPLDAPGTLTAQQATDILSAIFAANDFPAGTGMEMSSERAALDGILILRAKP